MSLKTQEAIKPADTLQIDANRLSHHHDKPYQKTPLPLGVGVLFKVALPVVPWAES